MLFKNRFLFVLNSSGENPYKNQVKTVTESSPILVNALECCFMLKSIIFLIP